ncbi:MAG: nicotinate phosphoribosyltransferase [Chloroflexota bacterium]
MGRSDGLQHPALTTDLYHPDAAYVSWRAGRNGLTTFDLYSRKAPFGGSYMLVAGLAEALARVREFRYTDDDLAYLKQARGYDVGFLHALRELRFSGDIWAMPEGSIAFPNEPMLRVTAPFQEALLLESTLLQAVNLATLIATKASRITWAAQGRPVAEFALRRAQNPMVVARSGRIGGCVSTSYLAAALKFGLPPSGTIPHALVQLFDDELTAFESVAEAFERYTLLIDTYDVRRAIHLAADVAHRYHASHGHTLAAVRLDSGDLVADARYVRGVLDAAGLPDVRVLGSGDLDEYRIAEILAQGAPFDAFGVGTSLGVGGGSPAHGVEGGALGGVYKEAFYVDEAGRATPKIKVAGEKSTLPGVKQVFRQDGFGGDVIQLASEAAPSDGSRPLLRPVMLGGEQCPGATPTLDEIAEYAWAQIAGLPDQFRQLERPETYPVVFSAGIQRLRDTAILERERRLR